MKNLFKKINILGYFYLNGLKSNNILIRALLLNIKIKEYMELSI